MVQPMTDTYRPRYGTTAGPPPPPSDVQAAMYHFQGHNDSGRNKSHDAPRKPPRGFTYRPPTSARPLLTSGHGSSEGLTFRSDNAEDKFRNLDDMTDTDETEMEVSEEEDTKDRPAKRARFSENDDSADAGHKWSNPDPYTALPPADDSTRKKKDFVKLIRKARKVPSSSQPDGQVTTRDDDFISFDIEDDYQEDNSLMAPADAPTGPRLGRHDVVSSTLGKRSRKEFERPATIIRKNGKQLYSDGRVLELWQAGRDCNPTPWITNRGNMLDPAGITLHKEIIDFYEWVRPKDYEAAVRSDVINRLERAFTRLDPGGQLKAFGSYAAGLYLPTGDMDLVFLERTFRDRRQYNGLPVKPSPRLVKSFADFIRAQGLAKKGTVQMISGAKVPIIKFVELVSGLKIDLSFNNNTGVTANDTFYTWRTQHPSMPIIVSIIKQFLMIRGLNDVAVGGLGGFSVICLVTSLIQHMPLTGQPPNLGQMLVEFFNLYGKLFNRNDIAIRLDPPGYLDVRNYAPFKFNYDKPGRLMIIDPNRPENNISGGTSQIELICDCFCKAHDLLQEQLSDYENGHNVTSFLEELVGGDFGAYEEQRQILRNLHFGPAGQEAPAVILPPPPPSYHRHTPPPPPIPHRDSQTSLQSRTATTKNFLKRLNQFKRLRPDLTEEANNSNTYDQLVTIGGYTNTAAMVADLTRRELLLAPTAKKTSSKD